MPSILVQQEYDNFWAFWKPWLMEIGVPEKQAGSLTGMVLKRSGNSVTKARKVFGAVRESHPTAESVAQYLAQEIKQHGTSQ